MFCGIIYQKGKINKIIKKNQSMTIGVSSNIKLNKKNIGKSISCNGVCLTISSIKNKTMFFYLSKETISKTNFKNIKIGDIINLEESIKHGSDISGHYIFGHVDCVAMVNKISKISGTWFINLKLDKVFRKYLFYKGSISLNGVSITISKLLKNGFQVSIIPHTLKLTNLIDLKKNSKVNVEIDMLSKYLNKIYE